MHSLEHSDGDAGGTGGDDGGGGGDGGAGGAGGRPGGVGGGAGRKQKTSPSTEHSQSFWCDTRA